MNATAGCEAKKFGDTMICGTCCMMWTVHDKIKPACGKKKAAAAKAVKARADHAVDEAKLKGITNEIRSGIEWSMTYIPPEDKVKS